jgi:tetratricopeptide (TPR) repeat protein
MTRPSFSARLFCPKDWLLAAALVIAVFLAYQPAWYGGFIWDDAAHVTKPELRSWHGLYRIWFDLGATQQYYPLLHSTFWVEHELWGDATLGYHLVNILLHAVAAVMVAMVLRRLKIPGAFLAAAIFALHPVQVESVAWITEQKNTLSAVFYLAAALVYLEFDENRFRALYWVAFGLFVLGLLSKTVTATLPAALLVVFWWRRGQLSWRRDVLPLVPFFAIGAAAGLLTAWVERKLLGAEGAFFDLTIIDRCLIAGRAIWFYLGKLVWPSNLIFIYPRWEVSQAVLRQYLFPAAALLLLALLWALRRRWRGPLAGLLFFTGTLIPVLGFFNVYPFIYSFVADHFQYLASLGVIALASAGAALLLDRLGLWWRPGGYLLCLGLLAILAALTFHQSRMYTDIERLYRTTIVANPHCWMAHNNLGGVLADLGRVDDAIVHYQEALKIKPDLVEVRYNLGNLLFGLGRLDEAEAEYQKALKLKPDFAVAHNNLGNVLTGLGRLNEATAHYRKALEIEPDLATAHANLGNILRNCGRFDEAIAEYRKTLELIPDLAGIRESLDAATSERKEVLKSLAQRRQWLRLHPDDVVGLNDFAWLLATNPNASVRDGAAAVELAQRAIKLSGGREPAVLGTLAAAYAETRRFAEAVKTARTALKLAEQQEQQTLAVALRAKIVLYEAGQPFRQTSPSATPTP